MGFITSCDTSIPEAGLECAKTLEEIRDNRPWSEALAGMYYIKPNYVGRSSHMCNAGFVVVPHHRGLRVGLALGRSFLHFGPQLGTSAFMFLSNNIFIMIVHRI